MHEASDLSLRGLAIGVAIVVGGIVASLVVAAFLAESRPPVDGTGMTLQTAAPLDLARFRKEKAARLNSRGPIEGDPAHVHIPIEQAMRMLAEGVRK